MADSPLDDSLTALPYGGEPLPRRHHLTREDVGASQRGRMQYAILQLIAEKGYQSTTIGDIVDVAAVSRQTFYQHFANKEACFLAAFDGAMTVVRGKLEAVFPTPAEVAWRDLVRGVLRGYLRLLAREPAASWAIMVQIYNAGPEAITRGIASKRAFAELFRGVHTLAKKQEPSLPEVAPELFDVLVNGIVGTICDRMHTHGVTALPALEDTLVQTVLTFFGSVSNDPLPDDPEIGDGAGEQAPLA